MSQPSMLSSWFPPKSKFAITEIPDLAGKVAIVTGGNTGLGKVTCRVLVSKNASVYMLSRSPEKAAAAIEEIKRETGKDGIKFLPCDLADLASVRSAVEQFASQEQSLNMLFNSAGVMIPPIEQVTKQGYDMQFGTNVLGHAYLTKLLLPTLLATAKSSPDGHARVINTCSSGHLRAGPNGIVWDTLVDGPVRRKRGPWDQYYQSKWANVVYAKEVARRYGGMGIVSTGLDPGNIRTDLWRYQGRFLHRIVSSLILHDIEHGALTQLYAGTMPQGANLNGKYLIPWARVSIARKDTDSVEAGQKLWTWLEDQIAKFEGGQSA